MIGSNNKGTIVKNKPSESSILSAVMFLLLLVISFGKRQIEEPCLRIIDSFFTWNIFIPFYFVLLVFSIRGLVKIKNYQADFYTFALFSIIPLYILIAIGFRIFMGLLNSI